MSFKTYWENPKKSDRAWSAAIYQPHWFPHMKQVKPFLIQETKGGDWLRPRLFTDNKDPLRAYSETLYKLYKTRKERIASWLAYIQGLQGRNVLCCWCPYDKAAQRQLKEHGSFVCHLGVVAWFLRNEFDVECIVDRDRVNMVRFPIKRRLRNGD